MALGLFTSCWRMLRRGTECGVIRPKCVGAWHSSSPLLAPWKWLVRAKRGPQYSGVGGRGRETPGQGLWRDELEKSSASLLTRRRHVIGCRQRVTTMIGQMRYRWGLVGGLLWHGFDSELRCPSPPLARLSLKHAAVRLGAVAGSKLEADPLSAAQEPGTDDSGPLATLHPPGRPAPGRAGRL